MNYFQSLDVQGVNIFITHHFRGQNKRVSWKSWLRLIHQVISNFPSDEETKRYVTRQLYLSYTDAPRCGVSRHSSVYVSLHLELKLFIM